MTQHLILKRSLTTGFCVVAICCLTAVVYVAAPVFASTATSSAKLQPSPSPSVAPPSDAQTTQNLKDRIDTVLKSRTDQVKGAIDEMTLHKRGFIGEVERVIEKTITVKNGTGTEVLTIDPTVVILRDNKKASIDDIAVGDWVIAIGYTDGQNFTLRRLVVSSTTLMPKTYDSVIGTAQTVSKTQLSLSPRTGTDAITYQLNKTTHYEDAQGATLKVTDLKKDSQYLVISYTDQEQKTASFVKSLADSQK
jgi:hypothetical protein